MLSENQMGRVYIREELLWIGKSVLNLQRPYRIPPDSWKNIQNLGLGTARKTHRGVKGGKSRDNIKRNEHEHTSGPSEHKNTSGPSEQINVSIKRKTSTPTIHKLKIMSMNARSVNNKADNICDYIVEECIDICAITETWLSGNDNKDQITCGKLLDMSWFMQHERTNMVVGLL